MKFQNQLPADIVAQGKPPYILAHRGCRAMAPENSMAAFDLALEQGAHAIETDLHITKDRQIVCFHDAVLDRMSNGKGDLCDYTLAELRELTLTGGNGTENFSPQKIPTLDEFFTAYKDRAYFLLELKAPSWTSQADVDLLMEMVKKHAVLERLMVASFGQDILAAVGTYAPEINRGLISLFNPFPSSDYPLLGVWFPMLFLNPLYVWLCHRRGQVFAPLDPTPEPRLAYYLRIGVDFLLTDNPALTIARLKELKR